MSSFRPLDAGGAVLRAGRRQPLDRRQLPGVRAGAGARLSRPTAATSPSSTASRCWSAASRARSTAGSSIGFGLRALTVIGMSLAAAATFAAAHATALWHLYATHRRHAGLRRRGGVGRAERRRCSAAGSRRGGWAWRSPSPGRRPASAPWSPSRSRSTMIVESGWRHAYLVFSIVSVVFLPLRPVPAVAPHRGRARRAWCAQHAATRRGADGRPGDPRLAVLGAHLLLRLHLGRHLLDRAAGHELPARARHGGRPCRARARRRRAS